MTQNFSLCKCIFGWGTLSIDAIAFSLSDSLDRVNLRKISRLRKCVPKNECETDSYHSSDDDRVSTLTQVDLLDQVVHQRKSVNKTFWLKLKRFTYSDITQGWETLLRYTKQNIDSLIKNI